MLRSARRRFVAVTTHSADGGFSLVEVLVSLSILVMVMMGSAGFFISSLQKTNGQGQRQAAAAVAEQQLEYTRSVAGAALLNGRTQAAVNTLIGDPGTVDLSQDVTTSGNYDSTATSSSTQVVPITDSSTLNNVTYTIKTFINRCFVDTTSSTTASPSCTKVDKSAGWMYRISVAVRWPNKGAQACAGSGANCEYVVSTLRDQLSEPCFNSNISATVPGCGANAVGTSTPLITKFTPAKVATGSTTQITLTGSNFVSLPTIAVDTGGTVSGIIWDSPTQVRFTFTASSAASAIGTRVLTLTNPDNGVAKGTFEITASTISLTSVSPASVTNGGANQTLTLTGTGFVNGATITFDAGAGTRGTVTWVSATSMKVVLNAASGTTAAGAHTVTVTNPDGASASGTFTIAQPSGAAAITFTAISPTSVTSGTPTTMTLTGTGFAAGATVTVDAGGGTIGPGPVTRNPTGTSLTFPFTPGTAGTHTFIVKNPDGGTASRTFTITPKVTSTPVITSVTSPPTRGGPYGINGTGFVNGATVSITYIGAIDSTFVSSTKLTFGSTATWVPKGSYDVTVTVTNPDGGTDSFDTTLLVR